MFLAERFGCPEAELAATDDPKIIHVFSKIKVEMKNEEGEASEAIVAYQIFK